MGFDLCFGKIENGLFKEIDCEFNTGRYSFNREFSSLLHACSCLCVDSEYCRPKLSEFNFLKEKVLKFETNSELWLKVLGFLENNQDIYLYDSW